MRGFAISFVTLTSVTLAGAFLLFLCDLHIADVKIDRQRPLSHTCEICGGFCTQEQKGCTLRPRPGPESQAARQSRSVSQVRP